MLHKVINGPTMTQKLWYDVRIVKRQPTQNEWLGSTGIFKHDTVFVPQYRWLGFFWRKLRSDNKGLCKTYEEARIFADNYAMNGDPRTEIVEQWTLEGLRAEVLLRRPPSP